MTLLSISSSFSLVARTGRSSILQLETEFLHAFVTKQGAISSQEKIGVESSTREIKLRAKRCQLLSKMREIVNPMHFVPRGSQLKEKGTVNPSPNIRTLRKNRV